ncbi:MAG: ATP-binding protein [Bdellovibrionota bacterium]
MRYRTLFWKIFPIFLLVSIAPIALISSISYYGFYNFVIKDTKKNLEKHAQTFHEIFRSQDKDKKIENIRNKLQEISQQYDTRITLIEPDGKVVADSDIDFNTLDNHADRPEINIATKEKVGESIRYSDSLKDNYLYVAINPEKESDSYRFLRVSVPLKRINSTVWKTFNQILYATIILIGIFTIIIWRLSLAISQPIKQIKNRAHKIIEGEFDTKTFLPRSAAKEIIELATTIDSISLEFKKRIDTLLLKSREMNALFSSMTEGVLAIDKKGNILTINRSALEILQLQSLKIKDTNIFQIVRNAQLSKFIKKALNSTNPVGEEILLDQDKTRYLYIQASPTFGEKEMLEGIVIVINDMTQLKELERHKKDFVANVSHELRTPLTSIQGFSETLLNPNFKDEKAKKEFLEIINHHATRLASILEDLLTLAKIERQSDLSEIKIEPGTINKVIEEAASLVSFKAKKKHININIDCKNEIQAKINKPLLVSAVANLIDNAVKYSPENTEIKVVGETIDSEIKISVIDTGSGIAEKHITRLFERFYRVDQARSRNLGGTGLGLAIVKHIAMAHHGKVKVESIVGQGSCFSIHLPIYPAS